MIPTDKKLWKAFFWNFSKLYFQKYKIIIFKNCWQHLLQQHIYRILTWQHFRSLVQSHFWTSDSSSLSRIIFQTSWLWLIYNAICVANFGKIWFSFHDYVLLCLFNCLQDASCHVIRVYMWILWVDIFWVSVTFCN